MYIQEKKKFQLIFTVYNGKIVIGQASITGKHCYKWDFLFSIRSQR